jgi:energy-coupling factor transporter transmembrane protein EcfT
MAELSVFGYRHGSGLLHRMDVRCKLISLLLLTSAVVAAPPAAMAPLSMGAVALWAMLRWPLRRLGREIRLFLVFLVVVFVVRAAATPGVPVFAWQGLSISREGLQGGAVVVWRLTMILVLGLVFITTTPPSHLKAAVQWLLRPVPFVPGARAATMVGLIVRFIPVLHQQVRETQNALAARGAVRRRFSPRWIRYLVWPTVRRVMLAADQLSLAMLARGYQEDRTDPGLRATSADGLALAVAAAVLIAVLIV